MCCMTCGVSQLNTYVESLVAKKKANLLGSAFFFNLLIARLSMLDKWLYVWNKFVELVLDDFTYNRIDEEELERRLDRGESSNDPDELIKYAEELGYNIKLPS